MRHLDDQCVPFPARDRESHVGIVWRRVDLAEVNGTSGIRKRVRHVDLVRALDDLKGVGHVHRAWNAGQVALEFGITIDPMLTVLLFRGCSRRQIRNLAVTLDHAQ